MSGQNFSTAAEERPELEQTIQDDKEGMAATKDVIEASLGKELIEMNSVTIVNKPKEELIDQDVPIERVLEKNEELFDELTEEAKAIAVARVPSLMFDPEQYDSLATIISVGANHFLVLVLSPNSRRARNQERKRKKEKA